MNRKKYIRLVRWVPVLKSDQAQLARAKSAVNRQSEDAAVMRIFDRSHQRPPFVLSQVDQSRRPLFPRFSAPIIFNNLRPVTEITKTRILVISTPFANVKSITYSPSGAPEKRGNGDSARISGIHFLAMTGPAPAPPSVPLVEKDSLRF